MTKDEVIKRLCIELAKCHSVLVFINREVNLEMSYTKSAVTTEHAIESIVACINELLAENAIGVDCIPDKPKL